MGNGQGVTIQIDADTGEALNKLTSFFGNLSAQIAAVPKVAASAAEGLSKIPNAMAANTQALHQMREASMLTREGFHGLEASVLLLGGSRFPQLTEAVMAGRMALMTLRSASALTGVSLSMMAPYAAMAVAAIGTVAYAWHQYRSEASAAEETTKKQADALAGLPRVLSNIQTLVKAGLLTPAEANSWTAKIGAEPPKQYHTDQEEIRALSPRPGESLFAANQRNQKAMNADVLKPDAISDFNQQMIDRGYLVQGGTKDKPTADPGQITEALVKIRELQQRAREENLSGFDKEREKARVTYEERLAELNALADVASKRFPTGVVKFTADDLEAAKKSLSASYGVETAGIDTKEEDEKRKKADEVFQKDRTEAARQAAEQLAELERELTIADLKEGRKRGDNYEDEYQQRIDLIEKLYYLGNLSEDERTAHIQEATIKLLEGQRQAAEEQIRLEREVSRARLAGLQEQAQFVQRDPFQTDAQKQEKLLQIYREQNVELERQIADKQRLIDDPKTSAQDKRTAGRDLAGLQGQLAGNRQQIGVTQAEGTFGGEFLKAYPDLMNQVGNTAKLAADGFRNVFQTAFSSISNGITGLIMGTMTWGQALRQIGTSVVTSIVQSFSNLVTGWIMSHVLMAAISRVFHLQETAETAAHTAAQVGIHTAGESAKTGATAAGAGSRSGIRLFETLFHGIQVAIRFAAHLAGEIAMTAATAVNSALRIPLILGETLVYLVKAAIMAMSALADIPVVGPVLAVAALAGILAAGAAAMGAFEEGGYTGAGGRSEPAGIVHKGEFVFSAPAVQRIGVGNLQAMHEGTGFGGGGGVNVHPSAVHVVVVNDRNELHQYLKSNAAERVIIQHVAKNKLNVGINT